jgi:putative transposase
VQIPGGFYHVTARGNRRQDTFRRDGDWHCFFVIFAAVVERFCWRCHSYCLMPNHYHLLIETPQPNLSAGMQVLNGRYAQWFNQTHGLDGHLFQGRFHSVQIEGDWHLLELSRYIALNPVRAGLCTGPGDWPWSSYGALIGAARIPPLLTVPWILGQFDDDQRCAMERYRDFVQAGKTSVRGR